jgi:hypothetical protein
VAGIGGEMAEILLGVMEAEKAGSKRARRIAPGPETKSEKSGAGSGAEVASGKQESEKIEGQAAAGEEPEQKKKRGNGLERLKRAADRRLADASEKLADLLLDKAKEGKMESTQLLVKLAEGKTKRKPQEKKKKKSATSLSVEQLCSEPEWVEEKPKVGDVWVGDGWKNPETGEFVPAPR